MKASANARLLIEHYEGLGLHTYEDSVGMLTIGYGHTGADVHKGMVITQAEADILLAEDLASFETMLNARLTRTLTQGEFDALVSFLYNVGPGTAGVKDGLFVLKSGKPSTLWRSVEAGLMRAAAGQFASWNRAGGYVLAGLTKRRASEAMMFSTGRLIFY